MGSRQFIRHALKIGAIELSAMGRNLKSGRISPYFFNSGLFTDGVSLELLANSYAQVIREKLSPEVIYGPAYKGISLAAITVMALGDQNIGYAHNRKEVKDHGEGGIVVGASMKDKRVVIIDDVITDGASKTEALGVVRSHGGMPVGCVIAFDRQEKTVAGRLSAAQEFEDQYHIPVFSIANLGDLIEVLNETGPPAILERIKAYRHQYGA